MWDSHPDQPLPTPEVYPMFPELEYRFEDLEVEVDGRTYQVDGSVTMRNEGSDFDAQLFCFQSDIDFTGVYCDGELVQFGSTPYDEMLGQLLYSAVAQRLNSTDLTEWWQENYHG